jgi:hypothetical protein
MATNRCAPTLCSYSWEERTLLASPQYRFTIEGHSPRDPVEFKTIHGAAQLIRPNWTDQAREALCR